VLTLLTIPELRRGSLGVVRVTVATARVRAVAAVPRHQGGGAIGCWDNLVQITDVVGRSRVAVAGSMVLIRTLRVESEAIFSSAEDALVFLGPVDDDAFEYSAQSAPQMENLPVFRVFGGYQGKFTIETEETNATFSQPGPPRTGLNNLRRALSWYQEEQAEAETGSYGAEAASH